MSTDRIRAAGRWLLGGALVYAGTAHLTFARAAFFVAVFPGNIAQYVEGTDAFGLDSDRARLIRLGFQPLLVVWALWSTGAWRALADRTPSGSV